MKSCEEITARVLARREEYFIRQKKRRRAVFRAVTAVCCVCLIAAGALGVWQSGAPSIGENTPMGEAVVSGNASQTAPTGGVYIPPAEVMLSVPDGMEMDMLGFFIYQGRVYVQYRVVRYDLRVPDDAVGEYLGTATGMIDEWTKADGYVDYAGSVSGDFYAVEGFDPAFMLCMKQDDGGAIYYINDNGLTLNTGADLFEARLNVPGNIKSAAYQTRESWNYSAETPSRMSDAEVEQTAAFVDALCASPFMYIEDIPLENVNSNVYDEKEIYHLYIHLENGFTVHLRLFAGGYVNFAGLRDVCVQVEPEIFDAFVAMLAK